MEKYNIYLVEEPLASRDFYQLKSLKEKVNMPIMVDESLVSLSDAIALINLNACSWFNIRISKNGGFLKAKRILDLADQAGVKTQIGAHFGESDILESAKRHFAFGAKKLTSFEGGTINLLKEHTSITPLGYDDDLTAKIDTIDGLGLGIELKKKYFNNFI